MSAPTHQRRQTATIGEDIIKRVDPLVSLYRQYSSPTKEMSSPYSVVIRDEEFRLSKRQIEFDSPNFFTSCFLGDFRESSNNSVTLDRNPHLFAVIVEYLSGYSILPLSGKALPPTMDVPSAMRNLVLDAEFYGLSRLVRLLTTPAPPCVDLEWGGLSRKVVTLEEVVGEHLPPGVEYIEGGLFSENQGNPQPALVFAKNVPIRLAARREIDPMTKKASKKALFTIDYTQPRTATGGMDRSIKHMPSIIAEEVYDGGFIHIDDTKRLLSDFQAWWSNPGADGDSPRDVLYWSLYPKKTETDSTGRDLIRYEATLWADEILFTVTGRSSDSGDPVLHIKLVNVKARTRAAILDALSPPCSIWATSQA